MTGIQSTPRMTLICSLLSELYTENGVAIWLDSRNRWLGEHRPIDLCRTAEGRRRVYEAIQWLADGNAS